MSFETVTKEVIAQGVDQFILTNRFIDGDPSVKRRPKPPISRTTYHYVALRDTEISGAGGIAGWSKAYKKQDSITYDSTLEAIKASSGQFFSVVLEDWVLLKTETVVTESFEYFESTI